MNTATEQKYLSGLVNGLLWVCLDFITRVVGYFCDGLFEDGGSLSYWERCVQVRFALIKMCKKRNDPVVKTA